MIGIPRDGLDVSLGRIALTFSIFVGSLGLIIALAAGVTFSMEGVIRWGLVFVARGLFLVGLAGISWLIPWVIWKIAKRVKQNANT